MSIEVKEVMGIDTDIPADMELTDLTFEVLRMAEKEGMARFEIESTQRETIKQLAQISAMVGHELMAYLQRGREVEMMEWDPSEEDVRNDRIYETEYLLLGDGTLRNCYART